jgi:hypothetical protein
VPTPGGFYAYAYAGAVSLRSSYTATISVTGYGGAPAPSSIIIYPRGWLWIWYCGWSYTYTWDEWYIQGLSNYYAAAALEYTSSTTTATVSTPFVVDTQSGCFSDFGNGFQVRVEIYPSSPEISYSSLKTYDQVNSVITTDTGDEIYVVGSLDSLPTA